MVKSEQISLSGHQHIQQYLKIAKKTAIDKEDLNAVLRLSQHLRVFGLLSAVGYVNQQNAQQGKVRERTVPVWESLLGSLFRELINQENPPTRAELMAEVVKIADNDPPRYMANWRKAMMLSNHWNFWARAYLVE